LDISRREGGGFILEVGEHVMNWESIRHEWESSKVTLKDLAEKHDIKLGTLKSRKSRKKWSRGATKKDATNTKKVATLNKKDATNKKESIKESLPSDELTDKQRLFCTYYLKYFNATKAYQKAYECDYLTANKNAHRHMVNEGIKQEIDRMKKERTKGINLDAQFVLQKYIDIAFADITDYTVFGKKEVPVMTMYGPLKDDDGNEVMKEVNYVDFKESDRIDGTIVTEVKQGKDGVAIKLADKMKALEKLSLYFDLFPDKFKREIEEEKLKIAQQKVNNDSNNDKEKDIASALRGLINGPNT